MRKDELRRMTRQELLEKARELDVKGRSGLSKDELVEAIAATGGRSAGARTAGGGARSTASAAKADAAAKGTQAGEGARTRASARRTAPERPAGRTGEADAEPAGPREAAERSATGREPAGERHEKSAPAGGGRRSRAAKERAPAPPPAAEPEPLPVRPPAKTEHQTPPPVPPPQPAHPGRPSRPDRSLPGPSPSGRGAHPQGRPQPSQSSSRQPGPSAHPSRPSQPSPRPSGPSEEDEEGQTWNTASGRDPNYGRFLSPGSAPLRQPPARPRRPGGPQPSSPIHESLADRSERGRQRALDRSHGLREDLRRSGDARRGGAYTPFYNRPRDRGPLRDDRDRAGRPEGGRYDRGGGDHVARGRGPGRGHERDRRFPDRERRGPDRFHGERDRTRDPRFAARPEGGRPAPPADNRFGRQAPGAPARLQPEPPGDFAPGRPVDGGRERPADPGLGRPADPAPVRPANSEFASTPPLQAPRVSSDLEGFIPDIDESMGPGNTWEGDLTTETEAPGRSGLPRGYGIDRCRLMVRDPHAIHAYWEIKEESYEHVRRDLGEGWDGHRNVLRVHGTPTQRDPGAPPPGFTDVEFQEGTNNWYIESGIPDRVYRVDVGVLTPAGLFYPIVSSNEVVTPRDGEGPDGKQEWAEIPPGPRDEIRIEDDERGPMEGPDAPAAGEEGGYGQDREEGSAGPEGMGLDRAGEGGTVVDRTGDGIEFASLTPPGPGIPPGGYLPEWARAGSGGLSGVGRTGPALAGYSGMALAVHAGGRAAGQSGLGAAAWSGAGPTVYSEVGLPAGYSGAGPIDSRAAPAPPPSPPAARPFWFVLNTELIVYGATEPDASVAVQGVPVPLRDDGTFSLRFQLPDGRQVLDATAVSADGISRRTITPVISRTTTSSELEREAGGAR